MEGCVKLREDKTNRMGASSNINAARLAALQERKRHIEENLVKRNQELRQLCIQEAELTGITPPEMPLEPGETLPLIRKRIGTTYQLPESLLKNSNKDKSLADLEIEIQFLAKSAEAQLVLANEQNITKTLKRQRRAEYQKYQKECLELKEKLVQLKEKAASEHKLKKKQHRNLEQVDDNVSITTNSSDNFIKSDLRHSVRSSKHSTPPSPSERFDNGYSQLSSKQYYKSMEMPYDDQSSKPEDLLNSGFYRLSLSGYNKYMERRENINNVPPSSPFNPYSNYFAFNLSHNFQNPKLSPMLPPHSPHYQQSSPLLQHSPLLTQHSPSMSQLHSPHGSQQSPGSSQHSPQLSHQRTSQVYSYPNPNQYPSSHKYSPNVCSQMRMQSTPTSPLQKSQHHPLHSIHSQQNYRQYQNETILRNPHQIQPHMQYEQINSMSSGLGGCWKKNENGELVWCNSNSDSHLQRDKRFGSLDRRRNKRVHKRLSPSDKSATISTTSHYPEHIRNPSKSLQITNLGPQENIILVRTQSLGSVGVQILDNVYPSDDNSSCDYDNRSISDVNQAFRKHKEKEWVETSLDGPVSPTQSITCNNQFRTAPAPQPIVSTVLAPEEKYVVYSPPLSVNKPLLEIPAESNPSPRFPDTNIELLNNNIPKNCTIVQAGHCKPYHEETKPFEMSDFYKYSTKFKKSPVKAEGNLPKTSNVGNVAAQRSLSQSFEDGNKSPYQQVTHQYYKNSNFNVSGMESSSSLNTSLELGHLMVSDHFSAEMDAWYKDQQKNNNSRSPSKNRSAATLV